MIELVWRTTQVFVQGKIRYLLKESFRQRVDPGPFFDQIQRFFFFFSLSLFPSLAFKERRCFY